MLKLLLAALIVASSACWAQEVLVVAHRDGEAVVVDASADLPVAVSTAWQTVTDYDRLSTFIPDMSESKVLLRRGNHLVVDQKGSATFLLITRKIEVRLEIEERPFEFVISRAVSGSFREMAGRYQFAPTDKGTHFQYLGRIIPDFWIPGFVETKAVRQVVEKQFSAMVSEIMRRHRLPQTANP